jgi:hypothetical protein
VAQPNANLTRAEAERRLGRRLSDADWTAVQRWHAPRPPSAARSAEAADLSAGNAHAVAVQGGDPAPLRQRARRLRFKAVRLHVTARAVRVVRHRPRTPRPRARARRAAHRGSTRGSPGGDGEPPGGEPEPPSPLAVARAEALAERLSRAEIRLDEAGLARLRDIGLGGRRLDQALQVLVNDGRAEIVRWGPIVVLRRSKEGE